MAPLENAINELQQTLNGPMTQHWRWSVRQQLSAVKDALADENIRSYDGWLAARANMSDRDRTQLLARVTSIGPRILDRLEPERAMAELKRLLHDLEHFRQRLHDLVYDSVELEIGGSE